MTFTVKLVKKVLPPEAVALIVKLYWPRVKLTELSTHIYFVDDSDDCVIVKRVGAVKSPTELYN